jgi:hypothetical protein
MKRDSLQFPIVNEWDVAIFKHIITKRHNGVIMKRSWPTSVNWAIELAYMVIQGGCACIWPKCVSRQRDTVDMNGSIQPLFNIFAIFNSAHVVTNEL